MDFSETKQADRDASEYHPNHCHMDRGGSNTHPIHAPADSCQHPVLNYYIASSGLVYLQCTNNL